MLADNVSRVSAEAINVVQHAIISPAGQREILLMPETNNDAANG